MITCLLTGCVGVPKGVKPVQGFALDRYLGRWYEIARLDHSFERGLSHVTASYSMREDGGVRVLNRGYSEKKKEWKTAEGKAYFVKGPDEGYLKVSFFGPFYGGIASKKRTMKSVHLVSCFGVRSQRVKGRPARYGRVGDCRTFRCNQRFGSELHGGC